MFYRFFRIFNHEGLRWLIAQTKQKPFLRDNEKFRKDLEVTTKTSNYLNSVFYIFVLSTVSFGLFKAPYINYQTEKAMTKTCQETMKEYQQILSFNNKSVKWFDESLKLYEKVEVLEKYVNEITDEPLKENKCSRAKRILPWLIYTPFDRQISPNFELTYLFEFLSIFSIGIVVLPSDLLTMNFMIYATFQMELLKNDLINLRENSIKTLEELYEKRNLPKNLISEEKITSEVIKRLKKIIIHHEHIIQFILKVEECFTVSLFGQYVGSSFLLCMTLYQLSDVRFLRNFIFNFNQNFNFF